MSYDAWKLATPPEYEFLGPEPEDGPETLTAPCPVCGGDGGGETWIGIDYRGNGDVIRGWATCTFCGGTGSVDTQPVELDDLEPLVPR